MSHSNGDSLERGLSNRHIQMIALGGAIGTGLFYGSAASIQLAGPSIIAAYLVGGLVVYLIMRMLGEMSVDEPNAGAFSHFSYKYWGEFPGFLAGWNYWFLYVLVSMAELIVIGIYTSYWFPDFPAWLSSLIALISITCINLISVRFFGEAEFWFASVKIVAVIGMIALGLWLIVTPFGGSTVDVSNLWSHGGFLPNGALGFLLSLVVVMFSFGGTELIGVTAGEANNPKKSVPRAVKLVMRRILLFYVGSMTILMIIFPWNKIGLEGSPFVVIFSKMGIESAALILNFVVLTAAVSVFNSATYSNGRMLYNLAEQGSAPRIFLRLNSHKSPYIAILFSSACAFSAVIINYLVPDGAFMGVMALATAAAVITWIMICYVHLKFRSYRRTTGLPSTFPAPLYPIANYLCLAFLVFIVAMMTQLEEMKFSALLIPIWISVLYSTFRIRNNYVWKRKVGLLTKEGTRPGD